MELEQVWSLRVPEEHENPVRSREVPPEKYGQLIQWLECLSDKQNVNSSILLLPTKCKTRNIVSDVAIPLSITGRDLTFVGWDVMNS